MAKGAKRKSTQGRTGGEYHQQLLHLVNISSVGTATGLRNNGGVGVGVGDDDFSNDGGGDGGRLGSVSPPMTLMTLMTGETPSQPK